MAINFQVMTENQKNKYGKYVPDWEALKAGASCEEEKEYIDRIIAYQQPQMAQQQMAQTPPCRLSGRPRADSPPRHSRQIRC